MTKTHVDSLLQTFPKLLGEDSQHTFVETDTVRYLYQIIEDVNLVLITNKQSDIIEDLETLRLLARVVSHIIPDTTPAAVAQTAFDILFAFDEVLNMGYKENLTVHQIQTFMEMDSHEEKLAKIAAENKKSEALLVGQQRALEIERKRQEMREQGVSSQPSAMEGFGSSEGASAGPHGYGAPDAYAGDDFQRGPSSDFTSAPSASAAQQYTAQFQQSQADKAAAEEAALLVSQPKKALKGMSLGKKANKQSSFISQVSQQDHIQVQAMPTAITPAAAPAPAPAPVVSAHPTVTVQESVSLTLDRDGSCSAMAVRGQAKLAVHDPDTARLVLHTTGPSFGSPGMQTGWRHQLRHGADKTAWQQQGVIALADQAKGYPLGSDAAVVLVQWRYQDATGASAPVTITLWATNEGGKSQVATEFAYNEACGVELKDLTLAIPCPSSGPPTVTAVDGMWRFDAGQRVLYWQVPAVGPTTPQGTLEFHVDEVDEDSFAPVQVTFSGSQALSGFRVLNAVNVASGEAVEFTEEVSLSSDKVTVQ